MDNSSRKDVNVDGRIIGDGHPVYVIAEIGINHEGSVELAIEMVEAAWEAGADAVKIQSFITKDFLHHSHPGYHYDIDAEISHTQEQKIWNFARDMGITLFATPEEFKSLTFIRKQNPPLIKIAAMDFNYQELVEAAASLQKPVILSSGMSTLKETQRTIGWVEQAGNKQIILLHCVSCYPAAPETCNLRSIPYLKRFTEYPVGFSDHTVGIHIPLAAVSLGANVIEKHFTLDKKMKGPDHLCSADPAELRQLVNNIRDLETALGSEKKEPASAETAPRLFKRRAIYTRRDMKAGEQLEREDVLFLAPSNTNSSVEFWPQLQGKKLLQDIDSGSIISVNDVDV